MAKGKGGGRVIISVSTDLGRNGITQKSELFFEFVFSASFFSSPENREGNRQTGGMPLQQVVPWEGSAAQERKIHILLKGWKR